MNIEVLAGILLKSALVLYVCTIVAYLSRKQGQGNVLFGAGWALNLVLFVVNGIAAGEPPFGNMYHVLIFLALCMAPIYLLLSVRYGLKWLGPHFSISAAVSITSPLFMNRDIFWNRVPALQSPWFVPHVFAYMVSYALAAVAFAVTVSGLISKHWKGGNDEKQIKTSYQVLLLAYPFMTFGMLSGALWAEDAWGIYWSWDAKETWALITWTAYLIYFHSHMSPRFKPYTVLIQILAFVSLLITFFVVNLLPKMGSLLHSYA